MRLNADEFLRRFLLHVLQHGFIRPMPLRVAYQSPPESAANVTGPPPMPNGKSLWRSPRGVYCSSRIVWKPPTMPTRPMMPPTSSWFGP